MIYDGFDKDRFCEYRTACRVIYKSSVEESASSSAESKTVVVGTYPYTSVVESA